MVVSAECSRGNDAPFPDTVMGVRAAEAEAANAAAAMTDFISVNRVGKRAKSRLKAIQRPKTSRRAKDWCIKSEYVVERKRMSERLPQE